MLKFCLPETDHARLAIFDLSGREVALLVDGERFAGTHFAHWDGHDKQGRPLPSGAYLARFEAHDEVMTRKIVLAR